jgi:hypothetical protein
MLGAAAPLLVVKIAKIQKGKIVALRVRLNI